MELEYTLPFVAAAQLGSRAERGALLRNVLAEEEGDEQQQQQQQQQPRWALAWPLLQPMGEGIGGQLQALPFAETVAGLRFRAYQVGGCVEGEGVGVSCEMDEVW